MNKRALRILQKETNKELERFLLSYKDTHLYLPMSHSLLSKGKRLRPILTKIVALSVGKNIPVIKPALAIEIFHTASLIADDLPCMDDDDLRRGKKSLHKQFDESSALLTSYALLVEGFSLIEQSGVDYETRGFGPNEDARNRVCIALKETTKLSGAKGAILGQYLDLNQHKCNSEQDFIDMYYLKTGTLFQGAFTLGYIFGGGDLEKLHLVENLARHLGLAFQIRDDFEDLGDGEQTFVSVFGKEYARKKMGKEIEDFYKALDQLSLNSVYFTEVISFLFPEVLPHISSHMPV